MKKSLCEKNVPAKVYVGMRYWHPFTEEAIEQVPGQMLHNIYPGKNIFILPLAVLMMGIVSEC